MILGSEKKQKQNQDQDQDDRRLTKSKTLWQSITEVNRLPQVGAGFIAGTMTSTIINPLDVVKTRLQVQDSQPLAQTQKIRYRNILHGLIQLYYEEGVRGYFRGLVPKLLSRGPLSALSSLLYEIVLHLSRNDVFKN
jgi:hypothetical protein